MTRLLLLIKYSLFITLAIMPSYGRADGISLTRQKQLIHLLKQDCGSCHGMTLKGGLGPALLPENFINVSTKFITNSILQGRPGTAMPPWNSFLSTSDAQWLANQLKHGVHDGK
ncbi:c-type cytochrome [Moritella viscosa]|nr:cytochrome c [Moritella viscosa]